MAPRAKKEGIVTDKEDLSVSIADMLNKASVPAYFIGQEETPTDLKDYVSSGASILDLAVSNKPNAGVIASGRILEINGLEGSGKSLLAAHMMANVQKNGGIAVLIDTETAVNEDFYNAIGLDLSKMVYAWTNVCETIFETIEMIIEKVRKSGNKKQVIIVVDSIAAASMRAEMEAGYDKAGYGTDKAKFLSMAFRKITSLIAKQNVTLVFTNQLRQKIGAMAFADQWTTSGGKALAFYASVRLRVSQKVGIKTKEKEQIGQTISVKVIKNRLGPPMRVVEFDVYYDRGIDDVTSWIRFMKDKGIIDGTAAKYTFVDSNGEEFTFALGGWKAFIAQYPEAAAEMYDRIAEKMVKTYNSEAVSTLDDETMELVRADDGVNNFEGAASDD